MIIIKLGLFFLNLFYSIMKLFPTQNKITFISRQSDKPSIDFLLLDKQIKSTDSTIKTVILCKTLSGDQKASLGKKIKYIFHMFVQMYHLATSKVVILDSYCIVSCFLKHKKQLKIIQIWHSIGTMKKFGYGILDSEEGRSREIADVMKMHKNYDYILSSSEAYKDHLAIGFNCDINKILTMPLPRVDLLKDKKYGMNKKTDIYKKYPELKKKKSILYVPTFRKDETVFEKKVKELIESIDYNKFNLIIKLHPLSKVKVYHSKVINDAEFSSLDMLFIADFVISDYSCIIYEAAVLNIPLYFFNFDMKIYENNRGLALDYYNELPGTISSSAKKLIESIETEKYDMKKLKKFCDKYVEPFDGYTKRIVEFVISLMR